MTDLELALLAQKIRDAVWKGRDAGDIPPEDAALAMDTRELWQELTNRLTDEDLGLPG